MYKLLKDNPILLGAFFAFIQTILFSFIGLFVRLASEHHHTMDIMLYRHAIGMVIFTIILSLSKNGWQRFRQANVKLQLIRGIIGSIAMVTAFATFSYLSLSEAQSLFYAGPLFALFLSFPILKEKVGPYRLGAAIIGFIGVLLITQPSNISSVTGGILGVITAFGFAAVMITLRCLGRTQDAIVTAFYFCLNGLVLVLPFQPFFWTMPSFETLSYMVIIGVVAVGVQIAVTKAHFLAPPSVTAPISYLCLFWSMIMDFMIWNQLPLWGTVAGAALIIVANAFIVYREAKLGLQKSRKHEPL